MHFSILKMIATSGFLTALEFTRFVFGWDSVPDPTGGAHCAPPDSLAGFRVPYFPREGERKGTEGGMAPYGISLIRPWQEQYKG